MHPIWSVTKLAGVLCGVLAAVVELRENQGLEEHFLGGPCRLGPRPRVGVEHSPVEYLLDRLTEARLALCPGQGGQPVHPVVLEQLAGVGLGFFPGFLLEEARKEAQADPRKLFEDNWVDWLTTLSRAECDEGLRQAVEVVLDRGMLHPDPGSRPQTAGAA
eukprot:g12631.t1